MVTVNDTATGESGDIAASHVGYVQRPNRRVLIVACEQHDLDTLIVTYANGYSQYVKRDLVVLFPSLTTDQADIVRAAIENCANTMFETFSEVREKTVETMLCEFADMAMDDLLE